VRRAKMSSAATPAPSSAIPPPHTRTVCRCSSSSATPRPRGDVREGGARGKAFMSTLAHLLGWYTRTDCTYTCTYVRTYVRTYVPLVHTATMVPMVVLVWQY
jgi:hypothetical protein